MTPACMANTPVLTAMTLGTTTDIQHCTTLTRQTSVAATPENKDALSPCQVRTKVTKQKGM